MNGEAGTAQGTEAGERGRDSKPARARTGAGVIALGVRPEGPTGGRERIEELAGGARTIAAPAVLERARRSVREFGSAIAIAPAWLDEGGAHPVDVARLAVSAEELAVHVTTLPPLAAGILTALTSGLCERVARDDLVAALPRIESRLRVFAWVPGVNRLPDPRPRIWHRLVSLVPGRAGFVVSWWPQPRIWPLTSPRMRLELPPLDGGHALVVAARGADPGRLLEPLRSVLAGAPVTEAPATPNGPHWWGEERLVEAVAYPAELEPLVSRTEPGGERTGRFGPPEAEAESAAAGG